MPIVNLPNGTKLNFPDGMSEDDMKSAIHKNFPEYAPKGDGLTAPNVQAKVESPLLDEMITGIKSAFAGVGNAVDTAANLTLGGVLSNFRPDLADPLYQSMKERNTARDAWANPNKKELGIPGKLAGAAATLPQQFITSPLSPFTSGVAALDAGESLPRAMGAATVDTIGNAAGFLLGQGKTLYSTILKNAGANAAQEAITKWVQNQLMQTEQGKRTFDPNVADTLVAAIVGGGTAGMLHTPAAQETKPAPKPVTSLEKIKAERAAKEATPTRFMDPLEEHLAEGGKVRSDAEIAALVEQEKAADAQRMIEQRNKEATQMPPEVESARIEREKVAEQERLAKLREQGQVKLSEDSTPSAEHQAWATEQLTKAKESLDGFQRQVDEARQQARTEQERASVEEAQRVLDERQAALEFEVKKQGTLDFNAQERARQEAAGQEFQNPWLRNLGDKMAKQEALVRRLEADVQSGKKMGTQLVRARKDLKTMQGHYEKAKQNLGKVSDKQANPFGRDTIELNSGVPLSKEHLEIFKKAVTKLADVPEVILDLKPKGVPFNFKKQGGGILFGSKDKKPGSTLDKMIPAMSRSLDTPEEVIERAVDQTDIPDRGMVRKGQESLQKGFLYAKEQFNNAVMNFTYNKITEAGDMISVAEKRLIDDSLLPSLRDLSTPEFTKLWSTLLEGMKEKITFTPEELSKHYGFSEKQIASFEHIQTALRESFDNINAARKAQGKGEISPYIGYLAGMAKGAYKRVVSIKGEHGETVVGIIGSDFRHVVDSRMKALKEAHPEYIFSEEKFSGPSAHAKQDGSALVEALGILSDQNPNVDAFAKQMQDVLSAEAESYRGAKKHTMAKKGIWGMEGDKSWRTPEQNALDGMKGQVSYIREMIRWNELSKASQEIGKVLSDPSIQEKQKNAIERSREYLQNALGTAKTSGIDILVSQVANSLGLAPSFAEKTSNAAKNLYNTAFLALSPVFLLVNHISGATQFPAMAQYLSSKGIKLNADMGSGLSSMMEGIVASNKAMMFGKFANEFDKRAWEAAKDMAVISSQLIGHSNELRKNSSYYLNKTSHFGAAHSEASPRAAVFMATARLLKENGFENDPNIFHVARDVTDMTMGVFRKEEQPTVYNHFGALAPLAGQLSTFVTNANSNLMMAARMIPRDSNVKPLMAIMVSAMLMGGITGMPGFTQMDWLTEQWSSKFGKEPTTLTNEILKLAKDSKTKGALALGIPSLTGIDIHQSLGRSNLMPPLFSAGGQIGKTVGNLVDLGGDLAARDTAGAEMDAKRALLHVMPPVIRKNAEMTWFGKEQPNGDLLMHSTTKGKSSQGTISLSPEEQIARKFGMNTVSAFKKSQEDYQRQLRDQHIQDKQQKIMTRLDEVIAKTKGPYQSGEIRNVLDKYIEAEGDPKTFVSQLTAKGLGDQTTAVQRYLIQKANSGSLSAARALQRWKENQLVDRP